MYAWLWIGNKEIKKKGGLGTTLHWFSYFFFFFVKGKKNNRRQIEHNEIKDVDAGKKYQRVIKHKLCLSYFDTCLRGSLSFSVENE